MAQADLIDLSRRSIPNSTHRHEPVDIFHPQQFSNNYALLILNSPLTSLQVLQTLWKRCSFRICADGGANRLYELFADDETLRTSYLPTLIHGDLDSLRPSVRAYYASHSVPITLDEDQYSTDFGKALQQIRQHFSSSSSSSSSTEHTTAHADTEINVLILGSLGGRVDQGIGLLSEMMRESRASVSGDGEQGGAITAASTKQKLKLHLVSESSLTFLLPPGRNTIAFSVGSVARERSGHRISDSGRSPLFTPNIGILPLFGPAHITTRGLEYDVEDWRTEMGGQVSTSNHIVGEEVRVVTEEWLVFTVELTLQGFVQGAG